MIPALFESKHMISNKFSVTDSVGNDKSQELADFAERIGLESAAPGRYSLLLVLALYAGLKSGHLNPAKVVYEINSLEGFGASSQLKAPTLFRHPPLQGLWHKHYLENGPSAMEINFKKGILKFGIPFFEQRIREAKASGEERCVSPEDVKLIANDIFHGNWVRLGNAAALTGEWIVYAQYQGANYYLCISRHDSGDQNLRTQIDTLCCQEFPFLTSILKNA